MFTVTFETSGSAFDEELGNAGSEIARILEKLAERVRDGVPSGDSANILDANGNTIGTWFYSES